MRWLAVPWGDARDVEGSVEKRVLKSEAEYRAALLEHAGVVVPEGTRMTLWDAQETHTL